MRFLWLLVSLSSAFAADPLQLYSEFRRVDAKGNLLSIDSQGKPREVLSPGLIRGGYHSLRVVVRPPKASHYALLLAQNPEDSVRMTLYREIPAAPGSNLPDKLEPVKTPYEWDGTTVHSFWLDLFTPADAKVQRVRIEVQLHDGNGWIIYPMEVRILAGIVPRVRANGSPLPTMSAVSDTPARLALREYLCDDKPKTSRNGLSARSLVYRNAQQDIALARTLQVKFSREQLFDRLAQAAGLENAAAFCAATAVESPLGPEWYLKIRDFLYREASR